MYIVDVWKQTSMTVCYFSMFLIFKDGALFNFRPQTWNCKWNDIKGNEKNISRIVCTLRYFFLLFICTTDAFLTILIEEYSEGHPKPVKWHFLKENRCTLMWRSISKNMMLHTMNFGSEMVQVKHVSGKNIFCSMNKDKIREERIFEIVHCPFEGWAELHHFGLPDGLVGWC